MHLIALMIGIAMQAPAPSRVAILSECDASSGIVAEVPRDAALEVHYSIADAPPTCYFVSLTVEGKAVRGWVLDRQAPAVVAFEQSRVNYEQNAFKTPLPLPPSATPEPEPSKPAAVATKAPEEKKAAANFKKVAM